jgi:hypothetical protein
MRVYIFLNHLQRERSCMCKEMVITFMDHPKSKYHTHIR